MRSVALNNYPEFIFREGEKRLWNPVVKKAYKNRPEERVRLQFLEYLIREAGFSSSKISFESPVKLIADKSSSRTDIICYDNDFNPLLLVECKAPSVSLNENAAIQIARYNQKVAAPFLLITNGREDFWFAVKGDEVELLREIPEQFSAKKAGETDFAFWQKRGFAGEKSHPAIRNWIRNACEQLYDDCPESNRKYFTFDGEYEDLYLANYYRVFSLTEDNKIAVALTGTPLGSTKLNVVLNSSGINRAILSCSLDLIAENEPKNTAVIWEGGTAYLDLKDSIHLDGETDINSLNKKIARSITGLINNEF